MLAQFGKTLLGFLNPPERQDDRVSSFTHTLDQVRNSRPFGDLLPYDSYEGSHELFVSADSIGFALETLPLVGASEEMQKEVSCLFQHVLPPGGSLQVLLWADPHIEPFLQTWEQAHQRQGVTASLSHRRAAFLAKQALEPDHPPYTLRNFRCVLSYCQEAGPLTPAALEALLRLKNQLRTTLEMLGLPVLVWGPTHLLSFLEGVLKISSAPSSLIRWNRLDPLWRQVCPAQMTVTPHHLSMEEDRTHVKTCQVKTYQVRHYPDVWSLHAMGELIGDGFRDQAQLPCPFMIHYGVHVPLQERPKAKVLAKATYVERQAYSPIGKYLPSIQREAEELAFVRQHLGRGEQIVQTGLTVTLLAQPEMLDRAEQILLNLFHGKDWRLEANTFLHLPLFLSALPLMWGPSLVKSLAHLHKLKTTLSTEAANLLPLQGEWHGTPTPGMILSGRRGQVFTWHPFDNQAGNYNVCVVGRSGSGKSVFMQELMTSTLGLGGRVFVLDVGRSFEKSCLLLGGQFIEFTPKTPLCLNPFSTLPLDPEGAQDALAMLKSVVTLMAAPTQGVDDMESALIEQAMNEVWREHGTQSTITHVAQTLRTHADRRAQDLGAMLYPYTQDGVYGRFFNGPATVQLDQPLVVIELEELKERKDLQSVVVQMMILNITNAMFLGDRRTPFHLVIDEAWDMMRGAQSGVFIETLARRLRKYNGSLVVGTQSINDFFVNPGAQAAFDNSDWMCLLSQKKESIEELKKTSRIALTPLMEAQLTSLKTRQGVYAEVMIYSSQGYAIGRLLLDPYSQLLYSTKPQDYAAVQALKAQGYCLDEAIETVMKRGPS